MKQAMVERYFDWINERHAIYVRKQRGDPWPWTDDEILQTYKFTNVFRELDTVTVWIRENWREPFSMHPRLYFNLGLARQFNWPDTLEFLGYSADVNDEIEGTSIWAPQWMTAELEGLQQRNGKIFTGAYMIHGRQDDPSGKKYTSKIQYMLEFVLDSVWNAEEPDWYSMTLQQAHEWWMQFYGFGHFIAYEVVTDMRHTRYLYNAPDIMTWANPGPGAMRGLHRINDRHKFGRKLRGLYPREWYIEQMQVLLGMSDNYLEDHVPSLEMRDIEHTLCEFDKYERVRNGEGRPRSKYIPPHER